MAQYDVGKVMVTYNSDHDSSKEYEKLCIVKTSWNVKYISIKSVPKDTDITNTDYWTPLSGEWVEAYQGTHDSDPDNRNDGSDLQKGDLYYNDSDDVMKVYTGSEWSAIDNFYTKDESDNRFINNDGDVIDGDLEYKKDTQGTILKDRKDGTKYRLFIDDGNLGIEEV